MSNANIYIFTAVGTVVIVIMPNAANAIISLYFKKINARR